MDKLNQEFNQNGGTEKTVTWKTLGWILCLSPALVASDTAIHGLAIGVYAFLIIALSDGAWELKPAALSDKVKTPFCLICAAFLSILASLFSRVYLPVLYNGVGEYLPFLALYCVFLMTAFPGWDFPKSGLDLSNLALGFVLLPGVCGLCREFLGAGTLCGFEILPSDIEPLAALRGVPGAFIIPGLLLMAFNAFRYSYHQENNQENQENKTNQTNQEAGVS